MLVFSPHIVEGAKPSTSAKQGSHLWDEEAIHHDIRIVDLESQYDHQTLKLVIRQKDSLIMELLDNVARAKFIISFLEQENEQLKAKQLLLEKDLFKTSMQDSKGK